MVLHGEYQEKRDFGEGGGWLKKRNFDGRHILYFARKDWENTEKVNDKWRSVSGKGFTIPQV